MSEQDPEALANELEGEAGKMQEHIDQLKDEVQDVRQDWEQKRSDPSVAGANPPEPEPSEDSAQGDEGPRGKSPGWGRDDDDD